MCAVALGAFECAQAFSVAPMGLQVLFVYILPHIYDCLCFTVLTTAICYKVCMQTEGVRLELSQKKNLKVALLSGHHNVCALLPYRIASVSLACVLVACCLPLCEPSTRSQTFMHTCINKHINTRSLPLARPRSLALSLDARQLRKGAVAVQPVRQARSSLCMQEKGPMHDAIDKVCCMCERVCQCVYITCMI